MKLLLAEGVSKSYGVRWAIKDLSLAAEAGELVLLSGGNGVGKTTLLGCLSGLVRLSEGRIRLGDTSWDRSRTNFRLRTRIGVSLTAPFLYEALTLRENFTFFQRLSRGEQLFDAFLKGLALEEHLSKRPRECSDGIRKRASLCRAFLGDPEIVFLDEPFAHLDRESSGAFVRLLREYQKGGGTALLSVHEGESVRELREGTASVRVLRLENGGLREECS